MARALNTFTVRHGRMLIGVRLLATVSQVDGEFVAEDGDTRHRARGRLVHGYFSPAKDSSPHIGTIVLAANSKLLEVVPHECVHAVMHRLGGAHCSADETLATAVGTLSARIFAKLKLLGVEV